MLVFWREYQTDSSYLSFIRVTPTTEKEVFICGPSFKVIAPTYLGNYGLNSTQLALIDNVRLIGEGPEGDAQPKSCGNIISPTTFIWDQYTYAIEYDITQSFMIWSYFYKVVRIEEK
jgi:hypothetical protein